MANDDPSLAFGGIRLRIRGWRRRTERRGALWYVRKADRLGTGQGTESLLPRDKMARDVRMSHISIAFPVR